MPVSYGQVNAPSNTSAAAGSNLPALQGKQADSIIAQLHGKYYTQSYYGNVFWGSSAAAGLTLALVTAAAGATAAFWMWNPQGSGKNVSLLNLTITPTTAMTTGAGYGYGVLFNTGAAVGTAAPFSVFTQITATRGPALMNATGIGNSVLLLGSTATTTTAATFLRGMGGSAGTGAITAPSAQPITREDFDGTFIIPPGTAIIVGTTVVTSGQTATQVAATWEELPL